MGGYARGERLEPSTQGVQGMEIIQLPFPWESEGGFSALLTSEVCVSLLFTSRTRK